MVTRGLFLRFLACLLLGAFRHIFGGGVAFSNEGRCNVCLFDMGRACATKLRRLLWNTNLVEIVYRAVIIVSALVAILSSYTSVFQCQKTTLVQRSAFAETTCSSVHQKLLQNSSTKNTRSSLFVPSLYIQAQQRLLLRGKTD